MALIDRVQERFSTTRLAEITRPDATGSTVDTTFLGFLCDDIVGILDDMGIGTYDETDAGWVALACDGVEALGRKRIRNHEENRQLWESWEQRAAKFARTKRKNRIVPTTNKRSSLFPRKASRISTPGQPGSGDGQLSSLLDGEDVG